MLLYLRILEKKKAPVAMARPADSKLQRRCWMVLCEFSIMRSLTDAQ